MQAGNKRYALLSPRPNISYDGGFSLLVFRRTRERVSYELD